MPLLDAQPKRTSIKEILLAIKQRLVDWPVLDSARIKIIASRSVVPKIQAEQMIFISPGPHISGRNRQDGEGRIAGRIYRQVLLLVVNRVSLDEVDSDEIGLTDSSHALFVPDEDAVDALDLFWPEDVSRNVLLFEPMRVMSASQAKKDQMKPGWADEIVSFEIGYLANLDQTYQ